MMMEIPKTALASRERFHFVVVDDDPVFSASIGHTAERLGGRVTAISNLNRLAQMSWRGVDALLVDHELQNIAGTRLVSFLQDVLRISLPPIIYISANRSLERVDPAIAKAGFFTKSEGPKALLERVLVQMEKADKWVCPELEFFRR